MSEIDQPDQEVMPSGPSAPVSSPRIWRCPRCGRPDFEIVRGEPGHLILVCESCGYQIPDIDPRFAAALH